jgi:hypothetical protein
LSHCLCVGNKDTPLLAAVETAEMANICREWRCKLEFQLTRLSTFCLNFPEQILRPWATTPAL